MEALQAYEESDTPEADEEGADAEMQGGYNNMEGEELLTDFSFLSQPPVDPEQTQPFTSCAGSQEEEAGPSLFSSPLKAPGKQQKGGARPGKRADGIEKDCRGVDAHNRPLNFKHRRILGSSGGRMLRD